LGVDYVVGGEEPETREDGGIHAASLFGQRRTPEVQGAPV
jgi:hypothetical protein